MLDYRIYTFLSLCETLNYTQTARALRMTQPGVTQHIQLLEKEYGCRLFHYAGRTLSLTESGKHLEAHLRAAVAAEREQKLTLSAPKRRPLRLGATKTIGDFVIEKAVCTLADDSTYHLSLEIDNTDILLKKLDAFEIDLALIEGYFDKSKYAHRLLKRELFIGICAKDHPFAGQQVPIEAIFGEHILLREVGSGTRSILERLLQAHNYTIDAFRGRSCISSFHLLKLAVKENVGISFVYQAVAKADDALATFTILDEQIFGEFNYVYLPSYREEPWFVTAVDSAIHAAGSMS